MSDVLTEASEDIAPISLYLSLKPGEFADIEVVARAALAFADAVREFAANIDPTLDIRVELRAGEEGSLSLDALIRGVRNYGKKHRGSIVAIATAAAMALGKDFEAWSTGQIFDYVKHLIVHEHHGKLDQRDVDETAHRVVASLEKKTARPEVQKVYLEVERDPTIIAVGTKLRQHPGAPPTLVPRDQFLGRAGLGFDRDPLLPRRTQTKEEEVVLISPFLKRGNRRWKFSSAEGEFGAVIKDSEFVEQLLGGRLDVTLTEGIEMSVLLETVSEKTGGVWAPRERKILRVVRFAGRPVQHNLPFYPDGSRQA